MERPTLITSSKLTLLALMLLVAVVAVAEERMVALKYRLVGEVPIMGEEADAREVEEQLPSYDMSKQEYGPQQYAPIVDLVSELNSNSGGGGAGGGGGGGGPEGIVERKRAGGYFCCRAFTCIRQPGPCSKFLF